MDIIAEILKHKNRLFNLLDIYYVPKTPTITVPRMDSTTRDALTNVINGMIIYNTTTNKFQGRENGSWVNFV